MRFGKKVLLSLTCIAGLLALSPVAASARPHRHKVCRVRHIHHHAHRVCHWVR